MFKLALCIIICLFGAAIAHSQDNRIPQQLDNLLTKQFPATRPGCVVLVAKRGQVIYHKAFGSADLELNVPLNANMVFNLGSITKQFTAVAILQLVEQGKISLQDSVQKFIPDYPSKGHTITIEHLLTHTSGIPNYLESNDPHLFMERWDFSPKQMIDSFKNYPLEFDPGTRFSYSNSGYYLLGYIIARVSGEGYQKYIADHLLAPLKLTHTYFDSAGIIIPHRVHGYRQENDALKNAEYWSPTVEYAAGGLIANVDDLFKWHKGLYTYQVLRKTSLQKAFTSYQLRDGTLTGYGYGWFAKTSNGIKSIEHAGGLPGFLSNEIYFPDEDVFVAILCNNDTAPMDELSINISGIALNKPLQRDLKLDKKTLEKYTGVYKLSVDTGKTITILPENGHLVARVSADQVIPLLFQSPTKFQFKNLLDANCEFVTEKGQVVKINVTQNGHYEWLKAQ
ncbi:beta-lactamase family protein [Chitinophaga agrisoli]|uniref:Beta-lactamase family protein n=1 Tax=Chitinophaga agrisoli TaxID=2607653 RepID=A0A5B2VIZ4_9BACT|nr:serine hydrolase domain-containing protein [Chitinophaga agrisoli]KAA2238638.1 beta-lactamase family protein [Chitinophaga agrisoli]